MIVLIINGIYINQMKHNLLAVQLELFVLYYKYMKTTPLTLILYISIFLLW